MEMVKKVLSNVSTRRFFILALVGLLLYLVKDILNLVLLTFLIAYIMNSFQFKLSKHFSRYLKVNSKIIVIVLYVIFVSLIAGALVKYLPKLYEQISDLTTFLVNLNADDMPQNRVTLYLFELIKGYNYQAYMKSGIDYILKISNWGTDFFLSIILSFIFILEKSRIVSFTSQLQHSKLAWLYSEVSYLGQKFITSFGKVIEAQIVIALFNTLFSVVILWVLGFP